jgi:hypothetical protein
MVYKSKFVWIGSSVKLDYPINKIVASFSYLWLLYVTDKDTNIVLQDLECVSDKLNTRVDFPQ